MKNLQRVVWLFVILVFVLHCWCSTLEGSATLRYLLTSIKTEDPFKDLVIFTRLPPEESPPAQLSSSVPHSSICNYLLELVLWLKTLQSDLDWLRGLIRIMLWFSFKWARPLQDSRCFNEVFINHPHTDGAPLQNVVFCSPAGLRRWFRFLFPLNIMAHCGSVLIINWESVYICVHDNGTIKASID